MKKLTIGILAHVDTGKTTLSEAMLYAAGALRKLGRVDHGDAFLDTHAIERERGITIFSKQAVLDIGDLGVTLLDTPGHVDFSAEAERTLQVLDCAILVISGTDGVQGHTRTLWRLLERYHVPVFLFVNKMDLAGADAVMDLIGAGGALAARAALAAREGSTYRRAESIKAKLLAVAAQNAAYVDYPDDDIPELSPEALGETLTEAENALEELLRTFDAGRLLREGVDTAIVGTPNVGKSTLMNRLSGSERSIVTAQAGTTRDVVEESVRVGDFVLRLSDTAGIRETEEEAEAIGIRRARERMQGAALVLAVFDGSRPLSQDDLSLLQEVGGPHTVAILNKADQPLLADTEAIAAHISHIVPLSAKTGEGVSHLTAVIAEVTGMAGLDENAGILTTERQRNGVSRALEAVREAKEALTIGLAVDAAAVSIDAAILALSELTGEKASEAVINEVFARFCVGK